MLWLPRRLFHLEATVMDLGLATMGVARKPPSPPPQLSPLGTCPSLRPQVCPGLTSTLGTSIRLPRSPCLMS